MMIARCRSQCRWVAGLALVATLFGVVEPALGLGREADVHHPEVDVAASADIESAALQVYAPHPDHSPEHQHHTSLDHCTHLHGFALTAAVTLPSGEVTSPIDTPAGSSVLLPLHADALLRPPRS